MTRSSRSSSRARALAAVALLATLAGCEAAAAGAPAPAVRASAQQGTYRGDPTVAANVARFDQLDYESFNKQDWALFREIHHPDVVVTYPDGRRTVGIDQHEADIRALFVWAPDMQIIAHPVSFGALQLTGSTIDANYAAAAPADVAFALGQWTATAGVLTGTFTRPMPLADGTSLPPTGKRFTIPMATLAHWEDLRMVEEMLFWDSGEMSRQLGLGQ